jgi:hypothetical protein
MSFPSLSEHQGLGLGLLLYVCDKRQRIEAGKSVIPERIKRELETEIAKKARACTHKPTAKC